MVNLYQLLTNFLPTSYQLCTNFVPTLYQLSICLKYQINYPSCTIWAGSAKLNALPTHKVPPKGDNGSNAHGVIEAISGLFNSCPTLLVVIGSYHCDGAPILGPFNYLARSQYEAISIFPPNQVPFKLWLLWRHRRKRVALLLSLYRVIRSIHYAALCEGTMWGAGPSRPNSGGPGEMGPFIIDTRCHHWRVICTPRTSIL